MSGETFDRRESVEFERDADGRYRIVKAPPVVAISPEFLRGDRWTDGIGISVDGDVVTIVGSNETVCYRVGELDEELGEHHCTKIEAGS